MQTPVGKFHYDDVTVTLSVSELNVSGIGQWVFTVKFRTKSIFKIFHVLKLNGIAQFCNLFIKGP